MKKIALIIAVIFGISLSFYAQVGGGLFKYGQVSEEDYYYGSVWYALNQTNIINNNFEDPLLPNLPGHGLDHNEDAPLNGGVILLIGFGAAYALRNRKTIVNNDTGEIYSILCRFRPNF